MSWKLHNAMWPSLVGKTPDTDECPISLERTLDFTAAASVEGITFDGVDLFLYDPHIDISSSADDLKKVISLIADRNLKVGTLVAPVWQDTGGGSAMGSAEERERFLNAVKRACEIAQIFNKSGIRTYGSIRIDSATSTAEWAKSPVEGSKQIIATFKEAMTVASSYGERLVAEGEICWGGMHSWKDMLDILEGVGSREHFGFQADLAHTYSYLLGYNAPEHALLQESYSEDEFWDAYKTMTDALAPWTKDFHIAQTDGTVFGSGSHDKTGRHSLPDAPDGKLDIVECCKYWLLDSDQKPRTDIQHLCWDGCMFPNSTLTKAQTWNSILSQMLDVKRDLSK